ncbi:MAG TPA: FtsQ-type POTRA domain-containing protein [Terracidiphilus sp.]|jgi:cell division protein FtsQ|nr:FtsQ-type POTRA domain-containing protein [Terracidiphilus sp.]
MPLEMDDMDQDEDALGGMRRFSQSSGRWWRPASKVGRVFLLLGAVVVAGGLTAAVLAVRSSLEHDARFRITGAADIQATGLTEVSRAQMLPVFGEDIGRNVFFVPIDQRRKELEAIPWIERATVMRVLPDQIRVNVVERQPVAFTRLGSQIGLVDANGVLLTMPAVAMAAHHYSFPVITGIDGGDPAASRRARMAVYLRMMNDLDSSGQHYSQQISEIDLTDPEDARVLMPEQGADILAHFGEDHFLARYLRYKAHIGEWRQQYPRLAAVDLRYDQQVVLQMASGKETAQSAPGASSGPVTGTLAKPSPVGDAQTTAPKSEKSSSAARRNKIAQQRRKRAEARRTALNEIRRNSAHASRPAVHAAEGQ